MTSRCKCYEMNSPIDKKCCGLETCANQDGWTDYCDHYLEVMKDIKFG